MKKKVIIAIIAAIVVIGGGIGGYVYHSNQVKAEKMANYKKALSDYRFNSNRLIYSLDFVATDFVINWNSTIMNFCIIFFLTIEVVILLYRFTSADSEVQPQLN